MQLNETHTDIELQKVIHILSYLFALHVRDILY